MFLTEDQLKARAASSPFRMPIAGAPQPAEVVKPDESVNPSPITLVVLDKAPGRPEGSPNLDLETKALIGAIASLPGSQKEFAETIGMSEQRVSNYKLGKISGKDNAELKSAIQSKKEAIADTAMTKLTQALGLISEEKLNVTSAKALSGIAKDMSSVVKNITGDTDNKNAQNIFFIHSPISADGKGFHKEEFYETIEVGS